jgi:putative membrane protein
MKTILKVLITAILVMIIAHFMENQGVRLDDGIKTSIIVAAVLGLLNIFVKPILIFFTFPITLFTLGLFLLVINALIILICSKLVSGFHVSGFWTALWFSILLSLSQAIMYRLIKDDKNKN